MAEIFKVDVDDKVFWDNLIFVLSDILRTQLHLSCLNIVATLDESSVKHYPEHNLIREACMLENNLDITL